MTKRCIGKCTEALTKHTSPDLVTLVFRLSIQGILVVTYGCESWIIKKSECQIINAFKLWFWRKLLKVPWNARASNQSILKEINPDYSLQGLMLKLTLQYFGHQMQRVNSLENKPWCWERLKARGEGDDRGWDVWMDHWLNGHELEQTPRDNEGQGSLVCYNSWGCKVAHDLATEKQHN